MLAQKSLIKSLNKTGPRAEPYDITEDTKNGEDNFPKV
jgi:hypothetical protein